MIMNMKIFKLKFYFWTLYILIQIYNAFFLFYVKKCKRMNIRVLFTTVVRCWDEILILRFSQGRPNKFRKRYGQFLFFAYQLILVFKSTKTEVDDFFVSTFVNFFWIPNLSKLTKLTTFLVLLLNRTPLGVHPGVWGRIITPPP